MQLSDSGKQSDAKRTDIVSMNRYTLSHTPCLSGVKTWKSLRCVAGAPTRKREREREREAYIHHNDIYVTFKEEFEGALNIEEASMHYARTAAVLPSVTRLRLNRRHVQGEQPRASLAGGS